MTPKPEAGRGLIIDFVWKMCCRLSFVDKLGPDGLISCVEHGGVNDCNLLVVSLIDPFFCFVPCVPPMCLQKRRYRNATRV